MTASPFSERLATGRPLLLDAAMGTEIDRRGVTTALPLWSAIGLIDHPDLVRAIHRDELLAGAEIITTNTFRATERTLERAGRPPGEAHALYRLAVSLARQAQVAAGRTETFVAGSIAPLEDCYSPELTPPVANCLEEHQLHAQALASAGVDLLLIETMPTAREAAAALTAARATGLPATVGFVCASPGDDDQPLRLLSGERLAVGVETVLPQQPAAIMVNCAAAAVITRALAELRNLTDLPTGGYANAGTVNDSTGWSADPAVTPATYAEIASAWLDLGAAIIGGCCGTTPAHTAALRHLIDQRLTPAPLPSPRPKRSGAGQWRSMYRTSRSEQ
ncbi:MAG: homocysteine S-methyltransferase family protein [Chloroflexota bacterium]|nr:homocysteine S-methyltransferase family protein [Chloroflexota bacterium]